MFMLSPDGKRFDMWRHDPTGSPPDMPIIPMPDETDDEDDDLPPAAAIDTEVSPVGEKSLEITPVIVKPETPPELLKLKAHPLVIDDEPKYVPTGNLPKDWKAYGDAVREGLVNRVRKMPLEHALMLRELLDEYIAETQAEAASA